MTSDRRGAVRLVGVEGAVVQSESKSEFDVFCIGMACVDLTFEVDHHPNSNEKIRASKLVVSGGGPASNAAVCVSRLGGTVGFAGTIGNDAFGEAHREELVAERVDTHRMLRSNTNPTSVAAVLTKPDGRRSVVSSAGPCADGFDGPDDPIHARVLLMDGHEPNLSVQAIEAAGRGGAVTVLDAGSAHHGTLQLADRVDYLVASSAFASAVAESQQDDRQLESLSQLCPNVVITDGERGLVWKTATGSGRLESFAVRSVDETGAGDAFHAGFAFALAREKSWSAILEFASACGALACTRFGARASMPNANEVQRLLAGGSPRASDV